MRKMMRKEVSFTTIYLAEMVLNENGEPTVEQFEPFTIMGTYTKEQAQKRVNKQSKELNNTNVYKVEHSTKTYEMQVSDFIKYATVIENNEEEENEV